MPQNVDDFFWCLHDPSLVTWDPFRCSETVFYNFHVFYWNRSSNWATWVDDSSGRWIWTDFWKMTHEVTYQSVYGYGKSWPEMEFFLIDSFSHQILGFRHGFRLEWMFPIEWDGFLIIWTSHQTPEVFHYNHVPVEKKNKVVFEKYHENQHGRFLVHNDQFSHNPLTRGLDLRLRDSIRSFGVNQRSGLCQKIISVEGLRVKDRARELISEYSEGLRGRK